MYIHLSAKRGNIGGLKARLAEGDNIDIADRDNLTPLMHAVKNLEASPEVVRFLIENGADVNAEGGTIDNKPVLAYAASAGNIEKVNILLEAGANASYVSPSGYDLLSYAIMAHTLSYDDNLLQIVQILIKKGARPLGLSKYGESALRVASKNGRFDVVNLLLKNGADFKQLQWTKLMYALALGSLDDVKVCIEDGSDLSARDAWERTPWLLSLQIGDIEKSQLLLDSGADRSDKGRCGKTPLMYPVITGNTNMLKWLLEKGFDIHQTDDFKETALHIAIEYDKVECAKLLLKEGAIFENQRSIDIIDKVKNVCMNLKDSDGNIGMALDMLSEFKGLGGHVCEKLISNATSIEMVNVLLEAGHDINHVSSEMRRLLVGLKYNDGVAITKDIYLQGRDYRFGKANPEVIGVEFWKIMVRSGHIAYWAREFFDDKGYDKPIWTFERFGKSLTELPDGRFVEIAGEHEDFYDPDFCIYNDVVVHNGDGTFTIYGYPKAVFPPTDFHTATLVKKHIYIIGSVGYQGERNIGQTPVYRLDCETFKIEKKDPIGENPGWISRHRAVLGSDNKIYITGGDIFSEKGFVKNNHKYILDLQDMSWTAIKS